MDIEWRTIVADNEEVFDDYEISSDGKQVRSLNYYGHKGKIGLLSFYDVDGEYYQVKLFKDGKRRSFLVHRLVAFTYSDLIPNDNSQEKTEVNHINEDTHDNRVENLEWVTPKENVNHGTCIERSSKSRQKRVRCIETGQEFDSIGQASEFLGVTLNTLSRHLRGERKSCKGLHWEYVD